MIPPSNSISPGSLCDSTSFQLQNYNIISIVRLSLHFNIECFYKVDFWIKKVYSTCASEYLHSGLDKDYVKVG